MMRGKVRRMTASGFFDIQVNGYAGVDFNQDDLSAEALHRACRRLEADGVAHILATIVTENVGNMCRRLANIVSFRERDPLARRIIAGLHIEGPFLNENPGYRGGHPVDAIHPANLDEMKRLLGAAGGLARLVTLAPERDPALRVIRFLARQGIAVSAGHCDPSIEQLQSAVDAGVAMFTHLGNGCPMRMHRHDNIIQRVLSLSDRIWCCFIPDGAHVAFFALKKYLKTAGIDRCVIVTDAMSAAGQGPGTYQIGRWTLPVGEDLVVRAPDGTHLVGAALTMNRAVNNLVQHIGLTRDEAIRLTTIQPRLAMGLLNFDTRRSDA
jgi:N-acetylglucosamine-6-phosphate deacetylase